MSKALKPTSSYYTRDPNAPVPEKSASDYLGIPYDARFESYYESDYQNSGFTLPFSDYIGPKNSLNLGQPRTDADAAAKVHDLRYAHESYKYANGTTTKQEFTEAIEKADADFQTHNVWWSPHGFLGKSGIGLKTFVESVTGRIYPGSEQSKSQFDTIDELPEFIPLGKQCLEHSTGKWLKNPMYHMLQKINFIQILKKHFINPIHTGLQKNLQQKR